MRYLIVGSSIAFMMPIGIAITTNASSSIESYIKVDKEYNNFLLTQFDSKKLIKELEDEREYPDIPNIWEGDYINYRYQVDSPQATQQNQNKWTSELMCATNPQTPVEKCDVVGQREVKYLKNVELMIFIMKELSNLNRYPGLFLLTPFLFMTLFFKRNVMHSVK